MTAGGRPLRILHCHSTFALGGKEARAIRLMQAFGPAAEHVILSAMPDQMGARAAIDPAVTVDFPGDAPSLAGKPGVPRYRHLARYMAGFDRILSYNWGSMDAVMTHRLFARAHGLPPLFHHEDGFNADESDRLNWKRNAFRRLALPTARAVVVPSHRLERIARSVWHQGARVRRIANGIPVAHYAAPCDPGAIPGFVRRPGEVVVGTVAGLRAVKDLPLLVAAVAQLPPHVRLVIVGEGPERAAIQRAAAATGLGDRLLLPGFLAEPARYVGLFDMFALSSLSEQQPIAVIEAMAAGLPVVSPAVGDVAQMVAAENAPFIVAREAAALAGALARLADDPALRAAVGAANRAVAVSEFDEARMIAAYRSLYAIPALD